MNDPRYALTAENILKISPDILKMDEGVAGFLQAVAEMFEGLTAEISLISMYAAADTLPERLLDILAADFKIDWWDPELSVEEKRRVFKDNWKVHRTIGTAGAVEQAISAIYPDTTVEEWFDYEGEPYHFRLRINVTNETINSDRMQRVLKRLKYYKNLRSWNDGIYYFVDPEKEYLAVIRAMVAYTGQRQEMRTSLIVPKEYTRPPEIRSWTKADAGQYLRLVTMYMGPVELKGERP